MNPRATTATLRVAVCIIICLAAGGIGGLVTAPSIPAWYDGLAKPSFNPPDSIFGPVWTALYILMGIAAGLVWNRGDGSPAVKTALGLFAGQLALNVLWSAAFFGLRSPVLALADLVALWVMILLTLVAFWRVSALAGALLIPYIAWVSFAGVLNAAIVRLN